MAPSKTMDGPQGFCEVERRCLLATARGQWFRSFGALAIKLNLTRLGSLGEAIGILGGAIGILVEEKYFEAGTTFPGSPVLGRLGRPEEYLGEP